MDCGYTYFAVSYIAEQSLINPNITNQSTTVVLQTYLPILDSQIFSYASGCQLPPKVKSRYVEIELSDNTKYQFDVPFNSGNKVLWSTLLTQLANSAIKSWSIIGEKLPGYKMPLLLTLVP